MKTVAGNPASGNSTGKTRDHRWVVVALLVCLSLSATGCAGIISFLEGRLRGRAPAPPVSKRVILVVAAKPEDDPFVASMVAAAQKARDESDGKLELTVETTGPGGMDAALSAASKAGYVLVVTHSPAAVEPLKKISATSPNQLFLLVDAFCDLRNVRSVQFREAEGMFLLGAAAALTTRTGRVGLVGSADVPSYLRLAQAYEQGARHVRPNVTYIDAYVNSFNDAAKARELATGLSQRNVDVIMALADRGNEGVFAAAQERRFYTFGTWQDLCAVDPRRIVASIVKNPGGAVNEALKLLIAGDLPTGRYTYGLKEGGLAFCLLAVPDHAKTDLPTGVLAKIEELQKAIMSGHITVADVLGVVRLSCCGSYHAKT
jgi:basic membrane protein A